jgi:hypothetical protein
LDLAGLPESVSQTREKILEANRVAVARAEGGSGLQVEPTLDATRGKFVLRLDQFGGTGRLFRVPPRNE